MSCFSLEATIEQATKSVRKIIAFNISKLRWIVFMFCNISMDLSRDKFTDFCKY